MEMKLRPFEKDDAEQCVELFYDTIHSVNATDYTKEQLDAWAPPVTEELKERFLNFLTANISYVVELDASVVGFSDLDRNGHYNCLFVHRDFQGQGIGSRLYQKLEQEALKLCLRELTTEVSITARPFFEARGFEVVREQEKLHNGVLLRNYVMKKVF